MRRKVNLRFWILVVTAVLTLGLNAQTVPMGINYQAVARDNSGKEIANQVIQVKFTIHSGSGVGEIAYQELHANVRTTAYGVFSLLIGEGSRLAGTAEGLSGIEWDKANHFLGVEVDFGEGFINMGPMAFSAVPYALYAKRSLEPGPQGPIGPQGLKGDQGDPATDNQKLSFDGTNLSIAPNGNTVNLSTLSVPHSLSILGDTLSILGGNKVGLPNQIQDLSLDLNNKLKLTKSSLEVDLSPFKQNLTYNNSNGILSISNGTGADLSAIKSEAIQDLEIDEINNKLKITKNASATVVDLTKYLDNTDNQLINYDSLNYSLSISGGNTIKLGRIIAFRAGITTSLNLLTGVSQDLIFDQVSSPPNFYNDGGYVPGSGIFQAPINGIYSFSVALNLPFGNSSVIIKLTGTPYETIIGPTSASGYFRASITMKLNKNDIVNVAVQQSNGFTINPYIISGSFSGFRIY